MSHAESHAVLLQTDIQLNVPCVFVCRWHVCAISLRIKCRRRGLQSLLPIPIYSNFFLTPTPFPLPLSLCINCSPYRSLITYTYNKRYVAVVSAYYFRRMFFMLLHVSCFQRMFSMLLHVSCFRRTFFMLLHVKFR